MGELKAIKDGSIPIIHGKAELELHDREIRNKAIDDVIKVVRNHHPDIIKLIAQLKANGRSNEKTMRIRTQGILHKR